MRIFERVGATILVVIVLVSVCAPCFASGVEVIAGIDAFSALYNAYLVARGLDAVGSTANIDWSSTDPAASEVTAELWQRFYDEWAPVVTGTNDTVDTWWQNHRVYMGSGYIDSNGSYHDGPPPSSEPDPVLGLGFSAQLVEFFDKITSTVLKDQYDLTHTDSGFQHTSGSFDASLSIVDGLSIDGTPLFPLVNGVTVASATPFGQYRFVTSRVDSYNTFWADGTVYIYGDGHAFHGLSTEPFYVGVRINNGNSGYSALNGSSVTSYPFGDYYHGSVSYFSSGGVQDSDVGSLPIITQSLNDATVSDSGSLVRLQPSDKYLYSPIPVPDTDDPDYAAQPLQVPLNIPYISSFDDPDWTDSSDPAAQSIIDAVNTEVSTNTLEVLSPSDTDPPLESPSPVMPPFLPVDPPAAPFSFAGIWYYVVRWVNSCRVGMSWFFSIWTSLPAAMFYPIFGSAVAVIVIGTWRRFFE